MKMGTLIYLSQRTANRESDTLFCYTFYMIPSLPNPHTEFFFKKHAAWGEILMPLRTIILKASLTEELKWGVPCYTFEKKNVVLLHVFKNYTALFFFKGALLKDTKKVLVQQTKNVQAGRQIRFKEGDNITTSEKLVMIYLKEAIALEKSGAEVELKKTDDFEMVDEFRKALSSNPALKTAFDALTPGRQRGYLLYFGSAKQSVTRITRIEKYEGAILDGLGLDD